MFHEIQVITYAGFKGEERPQSFFVGNTQISVVGVLEMWMEEAYLSGKRRRFFRVEGNDGLQYKLCIDEAEKSWFLVSKTQPVKRGDSKE
jgi:hypothetical protein